MEKWRIVHDGFYEVSNFGNVRRLKPGISTFVGRPIIPVGSSSGYFQVSLGGLRKRRMYVHQLVAEAFLGEKPKGCVVNHIDGNKINNNISNLEYITYAENSQHAVKNLTRRRGPAMDKRPLKGPQTGDNHWTKRHPEKIARANRMPHSKMTEEKVMEARLRASNGERQNVLAKEYGICGAQMSRIIRGTRWKV